MSVYETGKPRTLLAVSLCPLYFAIIGLDCKFIEVVSPPPSYYSFVFNISFEDMPILNEVNWVKFKF